MRITCLKTLTVKRNIPYDPDYHGLIKTSLDLNLGVEDSKSDHLIFSISLKAKFVTIEDRRVMGSISSTAQTTITGTEFPLLQNGSLDIDSLPENFKRLIEGAVGEDVVTNLSAIARFAHLPTLFPIPIIFERKKRKATKKTITKQNKNR